VAEAQIKKEQAIAMAKRLAEEKAAREAKLTEIYNQRNQIWLSAQEQANRACASGYDNVSKELHQLARHISLWINFLPLRTALTTSFWNTKNARH
jgi:hypothetical protein